MRKCFIVIIFLVTPFICSAASQDVIQKDFKEKFVGYKMDPFVIQESKECLLEPYIPTFGGFDIFDGPVYKRNTTKSVNN